MRRVFAIPFIPLLPFAAWAAMAASEVDREQSELEAIGEKSPVTTESFIRPGDFVPDLKWDLNGSAARPASEKATPDLGAIDHVPLPTGDFVSGAFPDEVTPSPAIALALNDPAAAPRPSAVISPQPGEYRELDDSIATTGLPQANNASLPIFLIGGTLLVVMTTTCALLFQRPGRDLITSAVLEVQKLAYGAPTSRSAKADITTLSKILRRVIVSKEAPENLLVPLHDLLKRCESARHATTPITEATLLNLANRSTALLKNAQQATSRRPS